MFTDIKISLTKVHIYAKKHDNAVNIKGKTDDGYADRIILLDDPEGPQKAADLLQEIRDYHAAKLSDAQAQLDEQFPTMKEEVEALFSEGEESG